MVNKPQTQIVIDRFKLETAAAVTHFAKVTSSHRGDLVAERRAAESLNSEVYQRWEAMLSDWHIAAATRDATRLRQRYEEALTNASVKALEDQCDALGLPKIKVPAINWGLGPHPSHSTVAQLLDPKGRSLSFNDRTDLLKKSKRNLTQPFVETVEKLDADDWRIIELSKALRNATAHRSDDSLQRLNTAVSNMRKSAHVADASLGDRRRKIRRDGVGTYLNGATRVPPNRSIARSLYLAERLQSIAGKLV